MGKRDGTKNLIPFNQRTEEEQKKIQSKGGKASGESRRKRKTMRETLLALLELPMKKGKMDTLKAFEDLIEEKNVTVEQQILLAQIKAAMDGDTRAATFLRDTAGEKILKDAADNATEFEDDGFTAAIKAASKGVWDDDDKQA